MKTNVNGLGEKVRKIPMSRVESYIEKLGEIDDLRMAGLHSEAAARQALYFPGTPYREVVMPVRVLTGNRPV